jgi:hypothetical protein
VKYVSPIPEHRRVAPSSCAVLSRRLNRLVDSFKRRGVAVPASSRLVREARALAEVAAVGTFPTNRDSRRVIANAVHDVHEFRKIVALLGLSKAATLTHDLRSALKGTPEKAEPTRRPYQFQSQLWIGSLFAASSLQLTVLLTGAAKSPDFSVKVEGRIYGLEVKRPANAHGLRGKIAEARDQLDARRLQGGVALDVTDCIPQHLLFTYDDDPGDAPYAKIDEVFSGLYRQSGDVVFDSSNKRHCPGFECIAFLIVYVNGWRWTVHGPLGPELFTASQFGRFVTAKGNLMYWHADKIRSAYVNGLKRASMFISRETS